MDIGSIKWRGCGIPFGLLVLAVVDAAALHLPHRRTVLTTAGTVLLAGAHPAAHLVLVNCGRLRARPWRVLHAIHLALRDALCLGDIALAVLLD
jgi:hypothetical protein